MAKKIIEVERKGDKQYKELKSSLDALVAASEVADEKIVGFLK